MANQDFSAIGGKSSSKTKVRVKDAGLWISKVGEAVSFSDRRQPETAVRMSLFRKREGLHPKTI